MPKPESYRAYIGVKDFPSWEILVPDYCEGECETAWHSAEGMPCELYAIKRDHEGYEVLVRFVLDDSAEPYVVQVAGLEVEDSRHHEDEDGRYFDGYGDPRPPSDLTRALDRLRLSGLAAAMQEVFHEVTDWGQVAKDHDVDVADNSQLARRAFDRVAVVADVYCHAERNPLQAVMRELDMPKSTAALYVRRAKDRGDIPPSGAGQVRTPRTSRRP